MSTKTTTAGGFAGYEGLGEARPSFFKRAIDAIIEARMREAQVKVARHLKSMSNEHLRAFGLSDTEIEELRVTGHVPASHWR